MIPGVLPFIGPKFLVGTGTGTGHGHGIGFSGPMNGNTPGIKGPMMG
ncbi:hypothetical protein [Kribbella sp. NPDC006257]